MIEVTLPNASCFFCCCCNFTPSSQIENVTEALQRSYKPHQACEGTNTCRCISDPKHLAREKVGC